MKSKYKIILLILGTLLLITVSFLITNRDIMPLRHFKASDVKMMDDKKYIELHELAIKMTEIIAQEKVIKWQSMSIGEQKGNLIKNAHVDLEIFKDNRVDINSYKKHLDKKLGVIIPVEFIEIPYPTEPIIVGLIEEINIEERRILVISTEEYLNNADPEAYYLTIDDETEIIDENDTVIGFEYLHEQMKVEVYSRYLVLVSYPGQTGAEKIKVIKE